MNLIANASIFSGGLGFMGSSLGLAAFVWPIARISRARRSEELRVFEDAPATIELLIPAHNEERLIGATLRSLRVSCNRLQEFYREVGEGAAPRVRVRVGLDHCADGTRREALAVEGLDLNVIENPGEPGKWNMIQHLVRTSHADWIALVDVGSVWDEELLVEALGWFARPDVMAVAPSYLPARVSTLERLNWRLEACAKSIETSLGGPVSVHGATILYRRKNLLHAFEALQGRTWLNDDVVIPLVLRTRWPRKRVVYLNKTSGGAWVRDLGIGDDPAKEPVRRRRIAVGNLEWIQNLYWKSVRADGMVGLIATRRVLRLFWAYWISLLGLGFFFLVVDGTRSLFMVGVAASALVMWLPVQGWLHRARSAFYASLRIPQHFFAKERQGESWS